MVSIDEELNSRHFKKSTALHSSSSLPLKPFCWTFRFSNEREIFDRFDHFTFRLNLNDWIKYHKCLSNVKEKQQQFQRNPFHKRWSFVTFHFYGILLKDYLIICRIKMDRKNNKKRNWSRPLRRHTYAYVLVWSLAACS